MSEKLCKTGSRPILAKDEHYQIREQSGQHTAVIRMEALESPKSQNVERNNLTRQTSTVGVTIPSNRYKTDIASGCQKIHICPVVLISLLVSGVLCAPIYVLGFGILERRTSQEEIAIPKVDHHQEEKPLTALFKQQSMMPTDTSRQIVGKFVIDTDYLFEHKNIRWLNEKDTNSTSSAILSSPSDGCVVVTKPGTFFVISQITFQFRINDTVDDVLHSVSRKRNNDYAVLQKKDIFVEERRFHTIKKTSNLIIFPTLIANDSICVTVYPGQYIYSSKIDSRLLLFKFF